LTQTDLQNNLPVVTINNETVQPAPDGSFAYTIKLDKGEYEIVGEIKLGGYMIMRRTFKATVSKQLTLHGFVVDCDNRQIVLKICLSQVNMPFDFYNAVVARYVFSRFEGCIKCRNSERYARNLQLCQRSVLYF